jgi:hypothetical protein
MAGIGLLAGLVAMVAPWWTVTSTAGRAEGSDSARPFATGGLDDGTAWAGGVLAVGLLALVGALATAGWARRAGEPAHPCAPPIAIVGRATLAAAADVGWYLSIAASAVAAVGGFLGLGAAQEADAAEGREP